MVKILLVTFDGLQPSQIRSETMPNVTKLADRGVRFSHNHAVFPTVTRANSATVVTGVYPGKHGLTANKSVMRDYKDKYVVDALFPELGHVNDSVDTGLLFVPTLGERLSGMGLKWVSVVGGTSGNAFVHNPNAEASGSVIIHPEFSIPSNHHESIADKFGDWPEKASPAKDLVTRTADVVIEYALDELDPDVLMVWFPEPDTTHHAHPIDSPESTAMYNHADTEFGRLLEAVKTSGSDPDVFVVSDHGYSTIDTVVDVQCELSSSPFAAQHKDKDIVLAENGGSVLFYTDQAQPGLQDDLAQWLDAQSWVGAVATTAEDSFTDVAGLKLDGPRNPDICVALTSRPTGEPEPRGAAGASTGGAVGVGSHGGGSQSELHNTLIASGPSFRKGVVSKIPSGNIDIAPTIMRLLGGESAPHYDGRILLEALQGTPVDPEMIESNRSETATIESVTTENATYICRFG